MRILLVEHVENAVESLRGNRTRTILTTLGVTIGVASITTILSLSSGVSGVINQQIDALGGNIAVVRPQVSNSGQQSIVNPLVQPSFKTSTLSEADLNTISKIRGIKAVAPLMIINGSLQSKSTTLPGSTILATTPDFAEITKLSVRDGQFIDSVTNRDTAVIGPQLSINLFGTDQPIGQTFSVRGQTFTVIGVLRRMNNPVNFNDIDLDNAAIISLESGKGFHQGIVQLQQIDIQADSAANLLGVVNEINRQLLKNHSGEQDFSIVSGKDISQPTSKLFQAITSMMAALAAISLVVGGIGIMNIMLVGVAERTREIGLRKSVGASNANIVGQFMTEAMIISLLGGIFGYIGGYIVAFAISSFLTFDPVFTWPVAAAAFGTSIIVGAIFGLYPAIRAARKDPIESLRQYH